MDSIMKLALIWIPIAVAIGIGIGYGWRRWRASRNDVQTPTMSLTTYDLGYFPPTEIMKVGSFGEHHLSSALFKKFSAHFLTRADHEAIIRYMANKDNPDVDLEPIRIINAKASVYRLLLPKESIYADKETYAALTHLLTLLEPIHPNPDVNHADYREASKPITDEYLKCSAAFAFDVLSFFNQIIKQQHSYPTINWLKSDAFGRGIIKKLRLDNKTAENMMSVDILRSIYTAWAIKTKVKIPRDYIRYDDVTIHFLKVMSETELSSHNAPAARRGHLRIV